MSKCHIVGNHMSRLIYIFYFRSVNEVICHGIPDSRKLEDGDIVNSKYHCVFIININLWNN